MEVIGRLIVMPIYGLIFFGPLLVLLWPRQWYPWFLALVVPCYAATAWLFFRPLPSGDDWGWTGQAVLVLSLLAALAGGMVRLAAAWLYRLWQGPRPPLVWRPAVMGVMLTGMAAAYLELGPIVAGQVGSVWLFAVTLLLSAALLAASWLGPEPRWNSTIAIAGAASLACWLAIATWVPVAVLAAESTAEGRAYCVFVSNSWGRDDPARTLLDLSPWAMRTEESPARAAGHHGWLTTETLDTYYWSYRQAAFVRLGQERRSAPIGWRGCKPARHFARDLPLF